MLPDAVSTETVFAAVPVGLALLSPERRLRLANPAFLALLRLPPDAPALGLTLAEAMTTSAGESVVLFTTGLADGSAVLTAFARSLAPADPSPADLAPPDPAPPDPAPPDPAPDGLAPAVAALRTGLAMFGPDKRLLFCNPSFGALLGIQATDLRIGAPAEDVLPGTVLTGFLDSAAHAEPWRVGRPDGGLVVLSRDRLPDGGCVVLASDVTAQARVQERSALLDMVLLNVPHGICVYGPDKRVAMFNDTYNKVMQGAPLQLGDTLADVIRRRAEAHEYGEGDPGQVFAEQMAHDIGRPQMRRRVRPNGAAIDIRTAPLPNGGHISVVTDMTALVRAETALRQSAQEMATMLGSIRHGIVLWGPDRRLIASNPIAGELLGLPAGLLAAGAAEEDVVKALLDLGELGQGDPAADRARALLSADRSIPLAREIVTRSGRILTAHSTPAPDGGWVTTYTDVTPMRQAEVELRAARDLAEAGSRAKSRFLATVGHELRTPLNAIIGFSDVLMRARGRVSRAEIAEFAEQINQAGQQLLSLIDTVLTVARIESGRFETSLDVVDVARLVQAAERQVETAAVAGEVVLAGDLQAGLPPLRADGRQLQQALAQILANAVKFTPAGGAVTVRAALAADGGLEITVTDNGIGIEPAKLELVFEPFVQGDESLSRRYPGAGLGLFMARAIVAAHDGALTLDSTPGKGTVARMVLPPSRFIEPSRFVEPSRGPADGQPADGDTASS